MKRIFDQLALISWKNHFWIWLAFVLVPIFLVPRGPFEDSLIPMRFQLVVLLVLTFYLNYLFLIPRFFARKRWWLYAFGVLALVGTTFFVFTLIKPTEISHIPRSLELENHPRLKGEGRGFRFHLFIFYYQLLALSSSMIIFLVTQWSRQEKERQILEAAALKSELSFLRGQIQPHTLFNSLNSIYSLTLTGDSRAGDAILKLSDLLRYILYLGQKERVPLGNEIEGIENFIRLNSLRVAPNNKVTLKIEEYPKDLLIPPFLFLPFVENAFKYGVHNSQETEITVKLWLEKQDLYFLVENSDCSLYHEKHFEKEGGIGLQNVQRRLDLIYKDRYKLDIQKREARFLVKLALFNVKR